MLINRQRRNLRHRGDGIVRQQRGLTGRHPSHVGQRAARIQVGLRHHVVGRIGPGLRGLENTVAVITTDQGCTASKHVIQHHTRQVNIPGVIHHDRVLDRLTSCIHHRVICVGQMLINRQRRLRRSRLRIEKGGRPDLSVSHGNCYGSPRHARHIT